MFGFFMGGWELLIFLLMGLMLLCVVGAIIFVVVKVGAGKAHSVSSDDERIRCPECAEWIMAEAVKCRFCGAKLDPRKENHE